LDGLQEKPIDGSYSGQVSGLISNPESSEVLCSVWVPVSSGPGSVADVDGEGSSVGESSSAVAVAAAGDRSMTGSYHEVGPVVSVGFAAGGQMGSLYAGDEVFDFWSR
jgi:hypothetical protein